VEDPVFHRPEWNTKMIGNLLIFITRTIHFEWRAKFVPEIVNVVPDLAVLQTCMRPAIGVLIFRAMKNEFFSLIAYLPSTSVFTVVIDERVPHDRKQPSLEVCVFLEFLPIDNGFKHGILHQVTGFFPV